MEVIFRFASIKWMNSVCVAWEKSSSLQLQTRVGNVGHCLRRWWVLHRIYVKLTITDTGLILINQEAEKLRYVKTAPALSALHSPVLKYMVHVPSRIENLLQCQPIAWFIFRIVGERDTQSRCLKANLHKLNWELGNLTDQSLSFSLADLHTGETPQRLFQLQPIQRILHQVFFLLTEIQISLWMTN